MCDVGIEELEREVGGGRGGWIDGREYWLLFLSGQ